MKERKNKLSELLGFFYLVFISNPNSSYIKCWMDGNENYNLIRKDELIKLCKDNNVSNDILLELSKSFDTTSFYLWDVENNYVKRLYSDSSDVSINTLLKKSTDASLKKDKNKMDSFTVGWKNEVSETGIKFF